MDWSKAFPAYARMTKLVQPDNVRSRPARLAQAVAVLGIALGKQGFDPKPAKTPPQRLTIITPVALPAVRLVTRMSAFPGDRWDRLHQQVQLGDVVHVGTRQFHRQGKAFVIRDDVVFPPPFRTIRGIRGRLRPPSARAEALPASAGLQSIWSAARRRFSSTHRTSSHTPAAYDSRKCRQQVMPRPNPRSCGNVSEGMPLRSTNKMPDRRSALSAGGHLLV